ncbi:hypothetical protein ACU686_31795 [Yinghuangia aomiensis]
MTGWISPKITTSGIRFMRSRLRRAMISESCADWVSGLRDLGV